MNIGTEEIEVRDYFKQVGNRVHTQRIYLNPVTHEIISQEPIRVWDGRLPFYLPAGTESEVDLT